MSLVFRCRDWETYRAPLMYQSEGAIVPSSPSVGILKCTISGDKPLRIHTNQTSTHRSQLLCRRNVRSGIVCLYTRLHQLPTDVPIPLTLRCEFVGLRRDRYMMRHCSRRHRAEHQGSTEETNEMILFRCQPPRTNRQLMSAGSGEGREERNRTFRLQGSVRG